eukprot:404605-Rhodomonas_salina.3
MSGTDLGDAGTRSTTQMRICTSRRRSTMSLGQLLSMLKALGSGLWAVGVSAERDAIQRCNSPLPLPLHPRVQSTPPQPPRSVPYAPARPSPVLA